MRLFVALAVALFVAPSFAVAESQEPRDSIGVTVLRVEGKGVHVVWTVAPGAVMYNVYRGETLEDLRHMGQTPGQSFWDANPPGVDLWYVIESESAQHNVHDVLGPMRGRCLALRGTGMSFTLSNCMPTETPA